MNSNNRRHTPKAVELSVLSRSKRRCALCFALAGDLTEKQGQIAHLDHNSANWAEDNLAFLCLNHHSVYDSTTSQHKNYTLAEVKTARDDLYAAVERDQHTPAAPNVYQTQSEEALTSGLIKWYKDKRYLIASIILPVILAICGWIYQYPNSSRTESLTNASQNTGIVTQGQTGNNIINIPSEPRKDVSLFVKCELNSYPTYFPNDGTIYAVVMYSANEWSGIAELFAPANTPFKMLEGRDWLQTYRCEAVNYGAVPLFNVTMGLAVRYLEPVDTSNHSQTAGKEINANDRRLDIDKLDTGPEHAFHFYIFNLTKQFVEASLSQSATFRLANEKELRKVEIIRPAGIGLIVLSPPPPLPNNPGAPIAKQ